MRAKLALPIALALVGAAALLMQFGYFGPLSARVRGLFVKHTRTGNPLVDSVAEHQPANEQADSTASTTVYHSAGSVTTNPHACGPQAYSHYLHHIYHIAPYGFLLSLVRFTDANLFIVLYAGTAYFFSNKMAPHCPPCSVASRPSMTR